MNLQTKRKLILLSGIFLMIIGVSNIGSNNVLLGLIVTIIGIVIIIKNSKVVSIDEDSNNNEKKLCKYCKSEIDSTAKVCPVCRRTLNFSFLRVLIGVFIGLIILYFVFVNNNDAPLNVRKFVCGIGLRDDYPYCYYIDTSKLDEILNNN